MLDILWTILEAGLLILGIVIVYGIVVAVVMSIRQSLHKQGEQSQRFKQRQEEIDKDFAEAKAYIRSKRERD
jgi:uncharacterized membrane protein (DUF106 family)